ncbi:hypothetical protein [Streptomyces longwoodensis]|nr:hypothetical protein [Streptomyces longwoodensis]MCX5000940.1 hypothetical protein [Streptomyces longwoodensis]
MTTATLPRTDYPRPRIATTAELFREPVYQDGQPYDDQDDDEDDDY